VAVVKRILPFLLVAALLMVTASVLAQSSRHYGQSWHVLAGAGDPSSSASFAVNGTLTQFAIGASDSSSYRAESGYWYGLAPPIPFVPVGGLIVPVSKLGLLAPWIGVALLVMIAGGALLIWRRRGSR
jgi:cell division protein FtsW (lipid II flippase)